MISADLSNANWRKSRKTQANGACVELATDGETWTAIRDSKKPAGGMLVLSTDSFRSFLNAAKNGMH